MGEVAIQSAEFETKNTQRGTTAIKAGLATETTEGTEKDPKKVPLKFIPHSAANFSLCPPWSLWLIISGMIGGFACFSCLISFGYPFQQVLQLG